jgi:CRP-like cAMP-binding protein
MSVRTEDRHIENRLLARLPGEELQELRPHCELVSLSHGQHIIVPDEPIQHIFFPLNCLLSMVTQMEDGSGVESGIIGREGMSGIPVLLNAGQTTMPTFTQVPGEAVKVRARIVQEAYEASAALRRLVNRYVHTVVVVGSQSSACNARHGVEARFCRWLLMSSDGVGSDEVGLTHEYLAVMLGVRRASVTETACRLRERGLIEYTRGSIRIREREALEGAACECYGRVKAEYERLLGA